MANDTRSYASSKFIDASSYMSSKKLKPKVYVYVEDELDKAFWRKIFEPYNMSYRFNICLYRNVNGDSISGKDAMLKAVKEHHLLLGRYQLCCVDADYDLIIDVPNKYSNIVRNNIYVIHTCWYSMENIKCYPLHQYKDISFKISLPDTEIEFDFKFIISQISSLLEKLIIITIIDKKLSLGLFSIKDLKKFIHDQTIYDSSGLLSESFKGAVKKREGELQYIIDAHQTDYDEIVNVIKERFPCVGDYCCIMQGHTLLENIAVPLVKCIIEPIRRNFFFNLQGDSEQKKKAMNHYNKNTGVDEENGEGLRTRIESMFRDNYDFMDVLAYEDIQMQIRKAFQPMEELHSIIQSLLDRLHKSIV